MWCTSKKEDSKIHELCESRGVTLPPEETTYADLLTAKDLKYSLYKEGAQRTRRNNTDYRSEQQQSGSGGGEKSKMTSKCSVRKESIMGQMFMEEHILANYPGLNSAKNLAKKEKELAEIYESTASTLANVQDVIGWIKREPEKSSERLFVNQGIDNDSSEYIFNMVITYNHNKFQSTHIPLPSYYYNRPRKFLEMKRSITMFSQMNTLRQVCHAWCDTVYELYTPLLMLLICKGASCIPYYTQYNRNLLANGTSHAYAKLPQFLHPLSDLYWQRILEGVFWWISGSHDIDCYRQSSAFMHSMVSHFLFQFTCPSSPVTFWSPLDTWQAVQWPERRTWPVYRRQSNWKTPEQGGPGYTTTQFFATLDVKKYKPEKDYGETTWLARMPPEYNTCDDETCVNLVNRNDITLGYLPKSVAWFDSLMHTLAHSDNFQDLLDI